MSDWFAIAYWMVLLSILGRMIFIDRWKAPVGRYPGTVTVLVPAYNEAASIGKTIESLFQQTRRPDEIVVVDDCSQDGTGEVAARYAGVKVLRPERNSGTKAQAQNYALRFINTDLVVTIDADTTLAPDALEKLVTVFTDPTVVIACGEIYPARRTTFWTLGRTGEYLLGFSYGKRFQMRFNMLMVASGCFSAFRRTVLMDLGGFKKRSMAEDMDVTWQAHARGVRTVYVDGAICYPIEPETWYTYRQQLDRWYRAFFQNLTIHYRAGSFQQSVRLGFVVLHALLASFLDPVLILIFGLILGGVLTGQRAFLHWALLLWLVDVSFLITYTLPRALSRGLIKEYVLAIGSYLFLRPLNQVLFFRAFFMEMVLRKRLNVWHKGHIEGGVPVKQEG